VKLAERDLYTIFTSRFDVLHIWLAFKRTTDIICTVCMAARAALAL
jgi:hypothetical protein